MAATSNTNRVLVVDDDTSVLRSVVELIESDQYAVKTCETAAELFAALKVELPGCVLLDIALADADGLDVCRQLREVANYLPVLILSGNGSALNRYEAMRCAAVGLIDKPYEPSSLVQATHAAVRLGEDWWAAYQFEKSVAALAQPAPSIIGMMNRGASAQEVAGVLGMSHARLQSHIRSALEVLGVNSLEDVKRRLNKYSFTSSV